MLHFVTFLIESKQKTEQTLDSTQYELEIIFKAKIKGSITRPCGHYANLLCHVFRFHRQMVTVGKC